MEPFVPEPEERISTKDSTAGKARKGGKSTGSNGSTPPVGSLTGIIPAVVVALVLAIYVFSSNSAKDRQIETLTSQLDTLNRQVKDIAETSVDVEGEEESSTAETSGNPGSGRLNKLEKLVATQVSDLETMRRMVAETLSKLDSDLEGSLMNYYQKNRQSIEQLQAKVSGAGDVQSAVSAMGNDLKTLSTQLASASGEQGQIIKRLAGLENELKGHQDALGKLASTDKDIGAGISTIQSNLDELTTSVSGKVSAQEMEKVIAPVTADVQQLDQNIAALEKSVAAKASSQNLDQVAATVETVTSDLTSQLAAINGELATAASEQDIEQVSASLNAELDRVESQLTALTQGLETKMSIQEAQQANSALEQELELLSAEIGNRVSSDNLQQVAAQLNGQLGSLKKQLGTLSNDLGAKASGKSLEMVSSEIDGLKQQFARGTSNSDGKVTDRNLEKLVSGLNNEVGELKKQIGKLDAELIASRKNLSEQESRLSQVVRQIANQQAASGQVVPASMPADLDVTIRQLKDSQNALSGKLQTTQSQLEKMTKSLQAEIAGLEKSRGSAPATGSPGANISGLENQLQALAAEVTQSRTQLAAYDSEVDSLRAELGDKIASTNVQLNQLASDVKQGGGGGVEARVDKILKQIEVLKKQHPYAKFDN